MPLGAELRKDPDYRHSVMLHLYRKLDLGSTFSVWM